MKDNRTLYQRYIGFKLRVENDKNVVTKNFLSHYDRKMFKKMELYTFDTKNGYKCREISEKDFNEIESKFVKRKIIYVFDQENNLIYSSDNISELTRKFKNSRICIINRLQKQNLKCNDYYYSYNKDFKIDVKKQHKNLSLYAVNKIKQAAKNRVIKKTSEVKKVYEVLKENERLLVMTYEDIGNHFGVNRKTIGYWFLNYDFMIELYNHRKELIKKTQKKYEQELISKRKNKKIKEGSVKNAISNLDAEEVLRYVKQKEKEYHKPVKRLGKIGSIDRLKEKLKNI